MSETIEKPAGARSLCLRRLKREVNLCIIAGNYAAVTVWTLNINCLRLPPLCCWSPLNGTLYTDAICHSYLLSSRILSTLKKLAPTTFMLSISFIKVTIKMLKLTKLLLMNASVFNIIKLVQIFPLTMFVMDKLCSKQKCVCFMYVFFFLLQQHVDHPEELFSFCQMPDSSNIFHLSLSFTSFTIVWWEVT